jgi:Rieske Fe-S protein
MQNPPENIAPTVDPQLASPQAPASPCQGNHLGHARTDEPGGRRSFLQWLTYALGAAAAALFGAPFVGYLLGTEKRKPAWVDVGPISKFPLNETRTVAFDNPLRTPWDGITGHTGIFVRNQGQDENQAAKFLVLSVNCAHLGCPVSWFPQSGLFMCPCHGGVYYGNGERASGPPPRGLFACVWRVRDGRLEVQAPHYPTLQNTLQKPA